MEKVRNKDVKPFMTISKFLVESIKIGGYIVNMSA